MTDLAEVDRPSKVAGDTVPLVLAGALLAVLMTVTFAVSAVFGLLATTLLLAVALGLARPHLVTLIVVGAVYSNAAVIAVRMHGVPRAVVMVLALALLVPIAHRMLHDRRPVPVPQVLPVVAAFGVVQVLSSLQSRDLTASAESLMVFAVEGLALLVLLVFSIASHAQLRSLVWIVVLIGAVLGGLSGVQQVRGDYDQQFGGFAQVSRAVVPTGDLAAAESTAPRLSGPIGEKNRYAQILVVLVPLGLSLARTARRRSAKALAVGATMLILIGTALTYSRGAAIALGLVLVLGTFLRLIRPVALCTAAVGVVVALTVVPAYGERLSSLDDFARSLTSSTPLTSSDSSIRSRATESLAALNVFIDHPILGVGPGAFPSYYRSYASEIGGRPRMEDREAHNLYLGVAAELGLLGLLLLLTLFAVLLHALFRARRAWSKRDPARSELAGGFILAIMLYMSTGLFLHLSYQRYFWILIALATVAATLPRQRTEATAATT